MIIKNDNDNDNDNENKNESFNLKENENKENENKKNEIKLNTKLNTDIMEKNIGFDFQPISLKIIFNNKDYKYKVYNNINLIELKNKLQKQFNFSYNISIKVKNEHKSIILDDIEFDKKNKIPLNLKQMKVINDSILVISKNENCINNDNDYDNKINNINNNKEDKENLYCNSDSIKKKVSNIVCLEDDRNDIRIINFNIKKTFEDFIKKIKKNFSLNDEFIIRLRK